MLQELGFFRSMPSLLSSPPCKAYPSYPTGRAKFCLTLHRSGSLTTSCSWGHLFLVTSTRETDEARSQEEFAAQSFLHRPRTHFPSQLALEEPGCRADGRLVTSLGPGTTTQLIFLPAQTAALFCALDPGWLQHLYPGSTSRAFEHLQGRIVKG